MLTLRFFTFLSRSQHDFGGNFDPAIEGNIRLNSTHFPVLGLFTVTIVSPVIQNLVFPGNRLASAARSYRTVPSYHGNQFEPAFAARAFVQASLSTIPGGPPCNVKIVLPNCSFDSK